MSVMPHHRSGRRALAALVTTTLLAGGIAVAGPSALAQETAAVETTAASETATVTATGINRGTVAVAKVSAGEGAFPKDADVTVTVAGKAAEFFVVVDGKGTAVNSVKASETGALDAVVITPASKDTDGKTLSVVFTAGEVTRNVDVEFVGGRAARQSVLFGRTEAPAIEYTSLGSTVTATLQNLEPGATLVAVGVEGQNWLPDGVTYTADDDGAIVVPEVNIPNDESLIGKGIGATLRLIDGTEKTLVARRNGVTPAVDAMNESRINVLAEKKVSPGLYQSVYSKGLNALFVTRAPFNLDEHSQILKLNPDTLEVDPNFNPIVTPEGEVTPREDRAFGIAVDEKNNTLWVGRTLGGSVTAYDATTGNVKKAFPVNVSGMSHPRDIVVDETTSLVYVGDVTSKNTSDVSENNIRIFDGKTLEEKGSISIPNFQKGPMELNLDQASRTIYTVDFTGKTAAKIELGADNKVTTYDLGNPEVQGDRGAGVAYDSKRNRLYVATQAPSWVKVIDLNTGTVISTITTGASPLDVLYDSVNDVVYSINRLGATVNLIDPETFKVTATRRIDYLPNQLSTDGNGNVFITTKPSRDFGDNDTIYKVTVGREGNGSTDIKGSSEAPVGSSDVKSSSVGFAGGGLFAILGVLAALGALIGGLFHAVQAGLHAHFNLPKL
ncbi:YncE family protein [Corynebacterium sp. CCM 9203]|uniref:YncE family protein n=1 Tax=Corynebacterium sp. CCM 9203 TaxID=3057615 RepID=UPI0035234FA1